MSEAAVSSKRTSESVRISSGVKRRLQEYCRRRKQPIRRMLDKAVCAYVKERRPKEQR